MRDVLTLTAAAKNTTAHGIAVPVVRGGADGTQPTCKEPVTTMIEQTNSDHQGELLHYVKKAAIMRSIVNGEDATALCGERFLAYPPANSGGGAARPRICPPCSEIFAGLAVSREEAVANA